VMAVTFSAAGEGTKQRLWSSMRSATASLCGAARCGVSSVGEGNITIHVNEIK